MAETDKSQDKTEPKAEGDKLPVDKLPADKKPAFDAENPQFRQDSRRQQEQSAGELKKTESALPGLRVEKPVAAGDSSSGTQAYLSWSNQSLDSALRHLDASRRAAELRLSQINSGGDRAQINVYQLLKDKILPELKASGRIPADMEVYPSQPQSPTDKVGGDFLLVNRKTGEFQFLDVTLRTDKNNVFGLRQGGVIIVENQLFDRMGALKTDEGGEVGEKAKELRSNLEAQIEGLSRQKSPFKLGADGTPLPSLSPKSAEETIAEINRLSSWAREKAKAAGASDPGFREMADIIDRSSKHSQIANVEKASPKLQESARKVSESEVLKYIYSKYKNSQYPAQNPGKESDVKLHKDGRIKMLAENGDRLDGGAMSEHLEAALKTLVNQKNMLAGLSNEQLKGMGADISSFAKLKGEERANAIEKALKSQPKFKAEAGKLMEKLFDLKSIVGNGGAVGGARPVISDNIISRLQSRNEETLLGLEKKSEGAPQTNLPGQKSEAGAKAAAAMKERGLTSSAEELASYHKNEKFESGKTSKSLVETMELLVLDQESQRTWKEGELESFKKLLDAYKDQNHPEHEKAVGELNKYIEEKNAEESARESASRASEMQERLKGNESFERLSDQAKMTDALKQLVERMDRLPKVAKEQGEFLTQQLKSAMRKQLSVSTDNKLPEGLRGLRVQLSEGAAIRVVDTPQGPVVEVPAKMLKDNPRAAVAEIYANASGICMLDLLNEKDNRALAMEALKPTLQKIVAKAEQIVQAQEKAMTEKAPARLGSEQAASERPAQIQDKRSIVTSFDGENLTFGSEKFHMATEIEALKRERENKVKDLSREAKEAREKAEKSKHADDIARANQMEAALAAERQNLRLASELQQSLQGQRGPAQQERARQIIKESADRALNEHFSRGNGSGANLSRFAAIAMVLSSALFLFAETSHAQSRPDSYDGRFR